MRISRSTGALSGLLIILLGIWGGIIPFVGPYFNYAFGTDTTWTYSTNRLWLCILPGAVAVIGGLMLLSSGHRVSGSLGSWLGIAAGGWFVVGPAVSRLWENGGIPIGSPMYSPARQMIELVGYFYGVGALLIGLSAFALGRFVSRPAIVTEPAMAESAAAGTAAPATTAAPAYERAPGYETAPAGTTGHAAYDDSRAYDGSTTTDGEAVPAAGEPVGPAEEPVGSSRGLGRRRRGSLLGRRRETTYRR